MPKVSKHKHTHDSQGDAYAGPLEHLADELTCLDLRLHIQVIKQRSGGRSHSLEPFRGLVLSDEEIDALLAGSHGPDSGPGPGECSDPDLQPLEAALAERESCVKERRHTAYQHNIFLPLPQLAKAFQLSPFEELCLIICLAPELDRKYEKLYAYLNDDISSKRATIGLVLDLLCPTFQQKAAARTVFNAQSPLLKQRFLQLVDSQSSSPALFLSRQVKLDDRIADYLLGCSRMDSQLVSFARLVSPADNRDASSESATLHRKTCRFVQSQLSDQKSAGKSLLFFCSGPGGSGKKALAEAVSLNLGRSLIVADLWKMLKGNLPFEEAALLLGREAALQPALLCLEGCDCLQAEDEATCNALFRSLLDAVRGLSPVTFVCSVTAGRPPGHPFDAVCVDLEFPLPDESARKQIWERLLQCSSRFAGSSDSGTLAGTFRFTPGQIRDALASAHNLALWHTEEPGNEPSDLLYAACRAQSHSRLSTLAYKVEPRYTRFDIVLPADQMTQLMELCDQSRCRQIVYGEWGFGGKLSSGRGLTALFSGPPGTGKTMAAEVIANELKLELYKIDLSQVVSKYIGETEKNLDRIFSAARSCNAILFFDEADALFGKRSVVKDAHDRYANIEIGYLLQKMEEHEGIAILATNLRSNMDEAFTRRLQVLVEFPFPDEEQREKIWRAVFPDQLPLASDINIAFLARQIKVSGGNIRNIAVSAAFLAAAETESMGMRHIIQATKREMQKMGRMCTKAELGEYYSLIEAQTPIRGGWWQ